MFPIGIEKFADLFTGEQLILYVSISVINAILLFMASMKFILVLQQCGYHGKRYFKWLGNKDTPYLSRLMLLCLLGFLFFSVLNMTFEPMFGPNISSYIGFVAYLLFSIVYINTESHVNAKVPLKKTKRLVRLCMTYILLLVIITYINLFF